MQKLSFEKFWKVWRKAALAGAILLIMLAVFWGVERSLPGSLWYPIKTGVFEKIGGFFVFSDTAKVAKRIDTMDARLSDMLLLVTTKGITPQDGVKLEAMFTEHLSAARNLIDGLQAKGDIAGAVRAASLLEVSLTGYEAMFLEVRVRQVGAKDQIDSLGAKISDARPAIQAVRSALETRLSADGGENLKKAAEAEADFAAEAIKSASALAADLKLSSEAASQSAARLAVAMDLASQGRAKLESGETGLAYVLFSQAFRVAESEFLTLKIRSAVSK